MAENSKPLTPRQRSERMTLSCKDVGNVDCGYVTDGATVKELRDAMLQHYIDEHPGEKIDDAVTEVISERYGW